MLLDVVPDPGIYLKGTTYTVLSAAGGVTGTFSSFSNGGLPLSINYFPTFVQLEITQNTVGTSALNGDPGIVQSNLENLIITAGSDLFNILILLNNLDSAALFNALDQFHPALFSALDWTNVTTMAGINRRFINRAKALCDWEPSCCKRVNDIWIDGFGEWDCQDRLEGLRGFDTHSRGIIGGVDHQFGNRSVGGIGWGYTNTHFIRPRSKKT